MPGGIRPCVGGPFDGRSATAVREHAAYLDANGCAWRSSRGGRALYKQVERQWVYVGHGAYICRGCACLVEPGKADDPRDGERARLLCPLCGAEQLRARS